MRFGSRKPSDQIEAMRSESRETQIMPSGLATGFDVWSPPTCFNEIDEEPEFLAELIGTFQTDTTDRLRNMELAFADCDREGVPRTAHCIKGSARQMGARTLESLCQKIELGAEEEPIEQLAVLASRLDEVFTAVCEDMAKYVRGLTGEQRIEA